MATDKNSALLIPAPIRSCSTPISAAEGKSITTIEGIAAEDGTLPIDLSTLLSKPDAEATGWSQGAATPFSELKADCSLSAGHLWCQSFRMTTGGKPVSGAGGLDIARQTLDWDLRMADSEVPPDADEPVSGTKPGITINGSLTAPEMARAPAVAPGAAVPEQDTEKQ